MEVRKSDLVTDCTTARSRYISTRTGNIITTVEETLLSEPSEWENWVSVVVENPAAIADIPLGVIAGFDLFPGKALYATC